MPNTPDPEAIAIEARRQSAQVRAAAGRLRASVENLEQRAAVLTSAERRRLLIRAAGIIVNAYAVREAAEKTIPPTAPAIYGVLIRQETSSLMASASMAIRKVAGGAYAELYNTPIKLAVAVLDDIATMGGRAKPKATNTAALRGVAAREAFDRARASVRVKHTDARNLAVIKSAGADAPLTFTGLASSTAIDRAAERFSRASLVTMRNTFPGTPIHVDHSFKIADLIGKTVSATIKKAEDGEYDLWITAELDRSSSKALAVYNAIKNQMPVSLSVGVIVLSMVKTDAVYRGKTVWEIADCEPLEISAVSLPMLPRARVTAAKTMAGA